MIDRKISFDLPVKTKEEAYEKIIETSRNNDYTTGNLFDFVYFKDNYRLIAIDSSKQSKLKDPQEINFIGRFKAQNNNGATILFIIEKSEETTFEFLQILSVSYKNGDANSSENGFSKFATRK